MWAVYLVGGLAVMGVLIVATPFIIMRGIAAFAELFSGSEVEDDET